MEDRRLSFLPGQRALRWLVGLLLVLLALALLLPGLLGRLLERQRPRLPEAGLALGPGLVLKAGEWSRGWFSTRTRWRIEGPKLPFPLRIDLTLVHGPFYPGEWAHGGSPLLWLADDLRLQGLPAQGPAVLLATGHGRLGLLGELHQVLRFPTEGAAEETPWLRLEGRLAERSWSLQGLIPRLDARNGQERLLIEDLRLRAEGQLQPAQAVFPFRVAFSVGRLQSSLRLLPAELEDLRLRGALTRADGRPAGRIDLRLDTSLVRYRGTSAEIAPMVLRLALQNLDGEALPGLLAALRQPPTTARRAVPTALGRVLGGGHLALERFMMRGSRGWVDMQLEGDMAARPAADWLGLFMAFSGQGEVRASRQWLLGVLERQLRLLETAQDRRLGEIARDEQAALQAERILGNLVSQGYFAESGGVYKSRVRLHDGALEMNGQVVDLLNLMSTP